MADPKTPEAPAKPKNDAEAKLAAAEAELAKLQAENKLALVQAEIDKLKNGGLTPAQVKRRDEALAKREKTVKETLANGKAVALYEITEKSYKPLVPGGSPTLLEPGTVIKIPVEKLPGESMVAVKAAPKSSESKFERA